MGQNVITNFGDNKSLFNRIKIDEVTAGTTILVPETHNAILIKDGQMLQTLSPGKYALVDFFENAKESKNCTLEVVFMSKTAKLNLLWGTAQKFLMFDPTLSQDFHVGMSGDYDVQIGDPRKCYLYLIGADNNLTMAGLQERLQTTVISVVENVASEFVSVKQVPFNQISVKKREISLKVLGKLSQLLMSEYGIAVYSFNIANIIIDENDSARLAGLLKSEKDAPKATTPPLAEEQSSVFCSNCGKKLSKGAKFCDNCGKKVDGGATFCPNCGLAVAENSKFCSNCGTKL